LKSSLHQDGLPAVEVQMDPYLRKRPIPQLIHIHFMMGESSALTPFDRNIIDPNRGGSERDREVCDRVGPFVFKQLVF
jgi:hypothetical protein